MFRFFILILALPVWAYEKQETQFSSSPIKVYESQDSEEELIQKKQEASSLREQQTSSSPAIIIREQPPVQVYSEPLTPQEKLVRTRKQAEEQTEDRIKTRLELLRLRDEKARMDKILSPLDDQHVDVQQTQQRPPIKQEIVEKPQQTRKYFIHLGMGRLNHYTRNLPTPQSIERIGASFTAGFGLYELRKISVEYTFNYSRHSIPYTLNNPSYNPIFTKFHLYSHSLALKYYLFSDRLRPFIGAVASINRRSYTTTVQERYRYSSDFYWNDRSSHALQGAFVTGAELFLAERFIVGIDIRFYVNIYDLEDAWVRKTSYYRHYYEAFQVQQPLPEEMSWYNIQGFFRFLL